MGKIRFTKMVASGNDFVVLELSSSRALELKKLAREICDRKYGVGADGLLILEKSRIADIKMRIFNADGSEAEMCGNGARCVALFKSQNSKAVRPQVNIEAMAGIIKSEVRGKDVKINLTDPKDIKLDLPLKVNDRRIKVNFINTGVPHVVIFVEGLDNIEVGSLGSYIRYHKEFAPKGANVNFVEVINNNSINVRTYERGVEDETLACGTGAVASALFYALRSTQYSIRKMNVHTKSGEILKVCFERIGNKFKNAWLEGKVKIVHKGEYYV